MFRRVLPLLAALVLAGPTHPSASRAQEPWRGENLQYFRKDIPRPELVQRMREFSFALGVRCQHCHTGGDGVSFEGVVFASDEKPAKVKARAMLRMVEQLNSVTLAALPARAEPRVQVTCATCHRGLSLPKTLQMTLYETVKKDGAAAAIARYRELRREQSLTGRWNFGEWEINELARRLTEEKDTASAIAILELNGEFHPRSAAIDFEIGELHLARGESAQAISRYRAALAKAPGHQAAARRLEELEKRDNS